MPFAVGGLTNSWKLQDFEKICIVLYVRVSWNLLKSEEYYSGTLFRIHLK